MSRTTMHGWAVRGIVFAIIAVLIVCAFAVGGCSSSAPATREVTVVKEVPVPYHQPCPAAADKPVVPKRVAEEHPAMPKDPVEQTRILAAKVLELFGYADAADGVMTACSKKRDQQL